MGTELVAIQREFSPRLSAFTDVLAPFHIPVAAFQAGALALFDQSRYLLQSCDVGSIMNSCMSMAVLGLRLDQASQQGCVVPFKGKAQPIVMVKGYIVIAGRAGYTLQGRLVREGEKFKEYGGSDPRIDHEPIVGNKGKIVGAYAVARSKIHPTLFSPIISIDDLIATRDRSQGYKSAMKNGNPHPWATDFEAMCIKTPKRLLAKDIPNDMLQVASWLETQHDLGRVAHLSPSGQGVIDAEATEVYPERQPAAGDAPVNLDAKFDWIAGTGEIISLPDIETWERKVLAGIAMASPQQAKAARERNGSLLAEIAASGFGEAALRVSQALEAKVGPI